MSQYILVRMILIIEIIMLRFSPLRVFNLKVILNIRPSTGTCEFYSFSKFDSFNNLLETIHFGVCTTNHVMKSSNRTFPQRKNTLP